MVATESLLRLEALRLPEPGGVGVVGPFSLELFRGEAVAVTGSTLSGAVLVRACVGLASPAAGRIRVLGRAVEATAEVELARVREAVGIVLQPPGLVANLTIRQNLLLPLVFRYGEAPDEPEARVDEVLDVLGLVDAAEERPGALGPGTTERAAVARALVGRPELLLLENLDAALTGAEIRSVMEICRRGEPGILLTATEATSAACSCCGSVVDVSDAGVRP